MVGHEREHVVLDVVIHVPVDEPADRIHVNRPAVEAVVQNILGQAGVLRVLWMIISQVPKNCGSTNKKIGIQLCRRWPAR